MFNFTTMFRLKAIIDEISALRNETTYRAALQIANLLDNNRKSFLEKMDAADFNFLLKNFEALSYSSPKDHNSPDFKREYQKQFESLMFHLNKIL